MRTGPQAKREGAATLLLRLRGHIFVVLSAVVCMACPALASAQVQATSDYLARMDSDSDGRVSLAEYQAWMGYAFERMDLDHDGLLTADELRHPNSSPMPSRLVPIP